MSLKEIVLHQSFKASPERVWSAITDHEGMSKWAGTDVVIVARGDASGVGTVRRLKIGALRIDEEVVYADAPRRLVYRVIRGMPVKFHRGEMLVEPKLGPSGEAWAELTWRIMLSSNVPGVVRGSSMVLEPSLRRGLRELAGLIGA